MKKTLLFTLLAACGAPTGTETGTGTNPPAGPAGTSGAPQTDGKQKPADVKTDVGTECDSKNACAEKACIFDGKNTAGKCSKACTSAADCPTSWSCAPANGGTGNYCVPDGVSDARLSPKTKGAVGDTCESTTSCESSVCLVRSGSDDIVGYCSIECDSFSDCPSFWKCEAINNGASKYCQQD